MKLRVCALALLCMTSLLCANQDSYFNTSSKGVLKNLLYSACFNLVGGFIERLVNEKTDNPVETNQQNMIVLHESEDKKGRINISVELAEKLYAQQHNKNAKHL